MLLSLARTALFFYLYSFIGWVCEELYCSIPAKRWVNRGFLKGPVCPIYGCGALMVLFLLQPLYPWPLALFFGFWDFGVFHQLGNGTAVSHQMVGLFPPEVPPSGPGLPGQSSAFWFFALCAVLLASP